MKRPVLLIVLVAFSLACAALPLPGSPSSPHLPTTLPTEPPASPELVATPAPVAGLPAPGSALVLFGVKEDQTLALRAEPAGGDALAELSITASDLVFTGEAVQLAGETWLAIDHAGVQGWLPAMHLIELTPAEDFCNDPQVALLVADVMAALALEDGAALAALTSPTHGLYLRHNWWNNEVWVAPHNVAGVFADPTVLDWGVSDGSGEPILGDFSTVLLPGLQEVVAAPTRELHCDDLENGSGPSSGFKIPPPAYQNANYMVVYRPAGPQDNEFDWRSFAFGIETIDGQPYLLYIVMYRWEI